MTKTKIKVKQSDKSKKNSMDKILLYSKNVSLSQSYITKNINTLVDDKKELEFIKENIFLLGLTNKIGLNSLIHII